MALLEATHLTTETAVPTIFESLVSGRSKMIGIISVELESAKLTSHVESANPTGLLIYLACSLSERMICYSIGETADVG